MVVFFSAAQAQEKKYLYKDSTLDESEELYDTSIKVVTTPVEEGGEKMIYEEKADETITTVTDTILYYNQLTVSPDSIAAWKNLKGFDYIKHLDSLLKAQKKKPKQKQEQNNNYSAPSGGGWLNSVLSSNGLQIFLWILAVLFVLFILYKLFLTEGAFRRKTTTAKNATAAVEEELITNESDFDALVRQALQQGNYRLAIRYQYLKTLHLLADKKFIELAADKTNYQYVREINNLGYQNDFAALTLNYEYVWYGEFEIEENIYRSLNEKFNQLNNKL
jgi:hypothetical protein